MLQMTEILFDAAMGLVLCTVTLFAVNEGLKSRKWTVPISVTVAFFVITFCAAWFVHVEFDAVEEKVLNRKSEEK